MKTKIKEATKALHNHLNEVGEIALEALGANKKKRYPIIIEDDLMIFFNGFECVVFPTTPEYQKEGMLAVLAIQSEKAKSGYNIYQVNATIQPEGFKGAVSLLDAKGKKLMELPFRERYVGKKPTIGEGEIHARVTSAYTEALGKNTMHVIDGINGNMHFYIAVVVDPEGKVLTVVDGEFPRTFHT